MIELKNLVTLLFFNCKWSFKSSYNWTHFDFIIVCLSASLNSLSLCLNYLAIETLISELNFDSENLKLNSRNLKSWTS